MVLRVSSNPPLQKKEEPAKTDFNRRFSFQFDYKTALVIGVIVLVVFVPIAAALAAPAMPASRSQVQSYSNATCPPLQLSPLTVAAYLQSGNGKGHFSQAAFKNVEVDSDETDSTQQIKLEQKKMTLLQKAAEEYQNKAELEDHPIARAIAFHQARECLKEARSLSRGLWKRQLEENIKILRIQEANACQEAATLAKTPQEKLEWIERGLEELNISPIRERNLSSFSSEDQLKCDAAASLWYTAAQAFSQLPPGEHHYFSIVDPEHWKPPFSENRFAAVQALRNAAHCSKLLGNHQEALDFHDEALEILKKIETTSYPLKIRIKMQEEVVRTSISAWNIERYEKEPSPDKLKPLAARAFSETMVVQQMYEQLIQEKPEGAIYFTIQRALRLEDAAHLSTHLPQRVELVKKARDIVQQVWEQNPEACLNIEDFRQTSHRYYYSSEYNLLAELKRATEEAEKKLVEENLKPIFKNVGFAWNSFRSWIGRKSP